MTEKEMVLRTVRELPDNCSLDEIANRIKFLAAVQKGLDQLERGEGIPHDEIKKQLASWLEHSQGAQAWLGAKTTAIATRGEGGLHWGWRMAARSRHASIPRLIVTGNSLLVDR